MKKIENTSPNISTILILSCGIYAPITVLINFICSIAITVTTMLQLWSSVLIFALSFFVALIIAFVKKIRFKQNRAVLITAVCLYTIISLLISAVSTIIKGTMLWCLFSMLLVIAYSVIISLMRAYVKIKNYLLCSLVYYGVSLIFFMILTTVIAGLNKSNQTMLFFGSFTMVYVIAAIIYFYVKRSFAQFDNEEKNYKRQFD